MNFKAMKDMKEIGVGGLPTIGAPMGGGTGSGGGGGAVDSVNGKTGVVVLDAEDVGAIHGVANIATPQTADGTLTITLDNGDVYTLDLNHVHPQYVKYELVESLPASPESDTLYLIAAT